MKSPFAMRLPGTLLSSGRVREGTIGDGEQAKSDGSGVTRGRDCSSGRSTGISGRVGVFSSGGSWLEGAEREVEGVISPGGLGFES